MYIAVHSTHVYLQILHLRLCTRLHRDAFVPMHMYCSMHLQDIRLRFISNISTRACLMLGCSSKASRSTACMLWSYDIPVTLFGMSEGVESKLTLVLQCKYTDSDSESHFQLFIKTPTTSPQPCIADAPHLVSHQAVSAVLYHKT